MVCELPSSSFHKLAAPPAATAEDAESQTAAAPVASPHTATCKHTHTHTPKSKTIHMSGSIKKVRFFSERVGRVSCRFKRTVNKQLSLRRFPNKSATVW